MYCMALCYDSNYRKEQAKSMNLSNAKHPDFLHSLKSALNSFIRSISKNIVFRTFDYHRTMRGHCIVYDVIESKYLYITYFIILCLIMEKWVFERNCLLI